LAPTIQQATGMDLRSFSWLTLLPMALMGIGGWLAPTALRRWGARAAICASLLLIALGCALRLTPAGAATGSLLIVTAGLCGAGVALAQSILPGLIKRQSPHNVAPMMGLYSAALMGGGALSAQLSPVAMQLGLSWQASLAIWAIPVLLALPLAWHALTLMREPVAPAPSAPLVQADSDTGWLLRRGRTWLLLISFGLMNGGYGSTVAWLAPFYQTHGWTATQSGSLLAILSIAQAASALAMPASRAAAWTVAAGSCWPCCCRSSALPASGSGPMPCPHSMPSCWVWVWAAAFRSSCWWRWTICHRPHRPAPSTR
jgi:CP family cyanate transporter-like MFS transporter